VTAWRREQAQTPPNCHKSVVDPRHRYLFTVFAVKTDKLDVKPATSAAVVGFNLHFYILAKAQIMGLFKR
jgi:phosphatidylethanolamine-binding protein (PEBP) family uncharacterized protein